MLNTGISRRKKLVNFGDRSPEKIAEFEDGSQGKTNVNLVDISREKNRKICPSVAGKYREKFRSVIGKKS